MGVDDSIPECDHNMPYGSHRLWLIMEAAVRWNNGANLSESPAIACISDSHRCVQAMEIANAGMKNSCDTSIMQFIG